MDQILYLDATVTENSRTRRLAAHLLEKLEGEVRSIALFDREFPPLDRERLAWRTACSKAGDFRDPYFDDAKAFTAADVIVVAAPYWDLSFPAVLKQYLETVCVAGLTFQYNERGIPEGLCRAKALYYVTTAGGLLPDNDLGSGYVFALAEQLFAIPRTQRFKAEMLDVWGGDAEAILRQAEMMMDRDLRR